MPRCSTNLTSSNLKSCCTRRAASLGITSIPPCRDRQTSKQRNQPDPLRQQKARLLRGGLSVCVLCRRLVARAFAARTAVAVATVAAGAAIATIAALTARAVIFGFFAQLSGEIGAGGLIDHLHR